MGEMETSIILTENRAFPFSAFLNRTVNNTAWLFHLQSISCGITVIPPLQIKSLSHSFISRFSVIIHNVYF